MEDQDLFDTIAIHGGQENLNPELALSPPIFQTATFEFKNAAHAEAVMSFESDDYVYSRGENPTLRLLEQRMAALEKGKKAVAFSSGMGAISTVLLSLTKPGDEILAHQTLYGSSHHLLRQLLPRYGIRGKFIDMKDTDCLEKSINKSTRVIYLETPANPSLDVIDIVAVCGLAKVEGIRVVVDNTFASPYFQNPILLGADVVVHSATKYLSGHGDLIAGIAVGADEEYMQSLKFDYMCELGNVLSPFDGWLLLRGIKTLGPRMRLHASNAMEVAKFLEGDRRVEKVFYPGLPSFDGHDVARRQMAGYSGVVSFLLKGGRDKALRFADNIQMIKLAVSLGDTETLLNLPFLMTHRDYSEDELRRYGLDSSLLRLSVGLEDERDIIRDIDRSLNF